jgi:hypothetical protein
MRPERTLHARSRLERLSLPLLSSAILLGALVLCGSGCVFIGGKHKTKAEKQVQGQKDIAASPNQVRLRMRSLVDPMCGELEQAADAISAGTTNPAVRKAALEWKIEGVPALRKALFQPDGFTALMDAWVLCNQMADYFESGPGKEALGAASAQAVAACRHMEEEMASVAASLTISGDVSRARAFARKWAASHPVRYSLGSRQSTLSRVLEKDMAGSFSAGEAVEEITTAVDDLNRKMDVYSDQFFRQARWEAEQFSLELSADQAIPLAERAVKSSEQAVATFERLEPAIERAVEVAEQAPKVVTSEREAAIKALGEELKTALEFAREERIAALKKLGEDLASERQAAGREAEKVVDHAMTRVAEIVGATVLVLLLAAIAGLWLVRRMLFPTV